MRSGRTGFRIWVQGIFVFITALLVLVATLAGILKLFQNDSKVASIAVGLVTIAIIGLACYFFRKRQRTFVLIGLVAIVVTGLCSWFVYRHLENKRAGKTVVLVANFEGPDEKNYLVTSSIIKQLREATEKYHDVEVVPIAETITEQSGGSDKARSIGKSKKAGIVVWGYYGKTKEFAPVTMYCEILSCPKFLTVRSSNESLQLPIAELETLKVVAKVSSDIKHLVLLVMGMVRFERDDFSGAIEIFTSALKHGTAPSQIVNPSDLYYCRGKAFALMGDCESAVSDLDKAVELDKEHGPAYRTRGFLHFIRGEFEKARNDFSNATVLIPNEASSHMGLVFTEIMFGDVWTALKEGKEAVRLDPHDFATHNTLGWCYQLAGDTASAVKEFTETISLAKTNSVAFRNRGYTYLMDGLVDLAAVDFQTAIRLDLKSSIAYEGLATIYLMKGDSDRALNLCNTAVSMDKSNSMTYYNRAQIHVQRGEICEGIDDLGMTISLITNRQPDIVPCGALQKGKDLGWDFPMMLPDSPALSLMCGYRMVLAEAYARRANQFIKLSELNSAFRDLNAAIGLGDCYTGLSDLYALRARIHFKREEADLALEDANSALKLNTANTSAHLMKADVYLTKGDATNALAASNTALEYSPRCAEAFVARAGAECLQGNFSNAMLDCDTAIRLSCSAEEVQLAYLFRGNAFVNLGLYEMGIADLTRLLALHPMAQGYYYRGWAYFKMGRFKEALWDGEKSIALNTNFPEGYYLIALAFYMNGNKELAIKAMQMALALKHDPSDEWLNILKSMNSSEN